MPTVLSRISRETKVAAIVLAVPILVVGVVAVLGLAQTDRAREDAEQQLAQRAGRVLRSLSAAASSRVADHEARLRRGLALQAQGTPFHRAQTALRSSGPDEERLFTRAHVLDAQGRAFDVERVPFDVPESTPDPSAREQVERLLELERTDPAAAARAAAELADRLTSARSVDAVAVALALQCGARAAGAPPDRVPSESASPRDGNLALALARRTLDSYRALRDDRAAVGESEPFGPAASHVMCEVLLSGLALGTDDDHAAFVDAVVDRREGAQRLRGELSESAYRVERSECRRIRAAATALKDQHRRRLDARLAECDAIDAALDLVQGAGEGRLLSAATRSEPSRLSLANGGLLHVVPLEGGRRWSAVAFTAPPERLHAVLIAEQARADAPEGADVVVRDAGGAHVAGRALDGSPRVLESLPLGSAFPGASAAALLTDRSVIEREADAARRYWLWILGAAALCVVAASLLAVRAVLREVRLARMKSDFVSNLSHELRTPLTSLRMFVETLQEGRVRDEAEAKECLGVIAQETDRLASLVDRVLQFAAFARGRAPIQLHSADAGEVVRRAVELFRKRAEAAGASIDCRIQPDLPEAIIDRDAVAQVVLNLLDNAVKHSGHDGPRIRVTARAHPPGGGAGVAIVVEDDGPGIPEKERALVFEEFYRGDDTLSRRTQGAGLGLALSRRIVLAHGGTIEVGRSGDLGGAAFRVILPEAAAGRRLAVAAHAAQAAQGGAR